MSNSITSRVLLTLFIISNITLCFADQESLETNFDQVEDTENKDAHKKLDLLKENRKMERTRHGRGFLSTNQTKGLGTSTVRRTASLGLESASGESADATGLELLHKLSLRMAALQGLAERHAAQIEILQHDGLRARTQAGEQHEEIRSDLRQITEVIHDLATRADRHENELRSLRQELSSIRRWLERAERRCFKFDDWESVRRDLISDIESIKSGGDPGTGGTSATQSLLLENIQDQLGSQLSLLKKNMTILTNMTSEIWNVIGQVVTKEYLSNEMHDFSPLLLQSSLKFEPDRENGAEKRLPAHCGEVTNNKSAIVRIRPVSGYKSFFVYCDFDSARGPWTVIQNRFDGSIEFYRDYLDYKYGFGNLAGEFWLGLENIYMLTKNEPMELLIALEDFEGGEARGIYKDFAVSSEELGYSLIVLSGYEPIEGIDSVGDSLLYHGGIKFSTRDRDRDEWSDGNCARDHQGGWWYRACETSNLNGKYLSGGELPEEFEFKGMFWADWKGSRYSLKKSRIALKSKSEQPMIKDS